MDSSLATTRSVSAAVFDDIQSVAAQERQRRLGIENEPPEIQLMRLQLVEEAKQMMADALANAEVIREDARREGYEVGLEEGRVAGLEQGRQQWLEEREEYRADVGRVLDAIEEERKRLWRQTEPQMVAFVLEVARKVVKDEAEINRDVALSVIRNALRRVVDTESIRIRVNAADLDTVRASREDLASLVDGIKHLEIVDDRRVGAGGCVLETNAGTIDARLDTQIDEITRVVMETADEAA